MPTRSPTSPGLGVQVIKPLAISPGPANKPDNQPQPLFRGEREKKAGRRETFFYAAFKAWQPEGKNAISLQTATPNTPLHTQGHPLLPQNPSLRLPPSSG